MRETCRSLRHIFLYLYIDQKRRMFGREENCHPWNCFLLLSGVLLLLVSSVRVDPRIKASVQKGRKKNMEWMKRNGFAMVKFALEGSRGFSLSKEAQLRLLYAPHTIHFLFISEISRLVVRTCNKQVAGTSFLFLFHSNTSGYIK